MQKKCPSVDDKCTLPHFCDNRAISAATPLFRETESPKTSRDTLFMFT